MNETNTDSGAILELPAAVDLGAARDIADRLKAKTSAGQKVWLNASKVETLALPGIQLMLAAIKPPGAVWIVDPSAAFTEAIANHGLTWDHKPEPVPAAKAAPAPQPAPAPAAQASIGAPASDIGAGKRILTIDDSKTMRDMLMLTLSGQGFDVLQAVDGQDGIEVLAKENVDVVITDINMPKLDGYGVIQHVRNKPEYDALPILVLTTESDKAKKERARDLGATGFIVKPFNPTSLVDVIRKVSP